LSDEKNLFKVRLVADIFLPSVTCAFEADVRGYHPNRWNKISSSPVTTTNTGTRSSSRNYRTSSSWQLASSSRSSTRSTTCSECRVASMALDSILNDCDSLNRLNCFYLMQDKLQSFADGKYDLARTDIENVYFEQRGDSADALEELTITKRMISTGEWARVAVI